MKSKIREKIFKRSMYMCEYKGCTRRATEIAHQIANTKENISMLQRMLHEDGIDATKEYIKNHFIDSIHNLKASCREHNDYFNCGYDKMKTLEIYRKCKEEL